MKKVKSYTNLTPEIAEKIMISYATEKQCISIAIILNDLGFKVYEFGEILSYVDNMKFDCFIWNRKNTFVQDRVMTYKDKDKIEISYDKFMEFINGKPLYMTYTTNDDIDPFGEEDWGYSIQESNTEKVEGEIKIEDYTSTWDNIFKTKYRNLDNGDIKDIERLLDGPVAMIYDGIKMFNGGEDCDINIIHCKHNDYVKITPFKKAIQTREDELRTSMNVWRTNLLKTEIREYKEKAFRFPMSMKIILLEVSKLSDFIVDYLSEIKDVILIGTGVYDQPVHFNMNDFDRIYYNTEPPSLIFMSKDENEVAFDLLKPIKYKQIVKKIVNTEIDPWGEEDWDDSLFEIKLLNFAEYNLNEMMKL